MRVLSFLAIGFSLLLSGFTASGQADNLMIVEYVDSDPGAGFAIELFNPTGNTINLSNYHLKVYANSNTTPVSDFVLSGTLAPCSTKIIGNTDYCNSNCSCTFTKNWNGVNGDDAIVLTAGAGNNYVDMIGLPSLGAGHTVSGVSNALYHNRLVRLPSNLIRYSSTNGVSANSWPGNPNINLPGWQVIQTPGCLQPGFTPTPPVVDLGTDQILCNQGNILDAGNAGTGATYQWNTGATTQTITVTSPNTYTVHVTKACAITSDFITISTITAGNDLSTCPGDTVELPKSTTTAQWSGGNGNFIPSTDPAKVLYVVDPNDFGLYTLQVSVTSACGVATDEMVLRVGWEEQTTSQIFAQPTAPQVSEPISFSVNTPSSSILGNETWDFGDGSGPVLIDEATRINTHTYAAPGDYLVTFTFYAPCPYQLTLPITVTGELIIPNVFTPNGDQVNDVFNVELPGTKSYSLKIFNRWGQLQFESTDRSKGWDGKGSPDGVYFMSLEATLTDGSPFNVRQTVSLISGKE